MLFDEPTSALDPELVGEVLDVMRGLAARRHDDDRRHARDGLRPRGRRPARVHGRRRRSSSRARRARCSASPRERAHAGVPVEASSKPSACKSPAFELAELQILDHRHECVDGRVGRPGAGACGGTRRAVRADSTPPSSPGSRRGRTAPSKAERACRTPSNSSPAPCSYAAITERQRRGARLASELKNPFAPEPERGQRLQRTAHVNVDPCRRLRR